MRVGIVTESFLPSTNGVTISVCRVLDHLGLRGHDAAVLCPGPAPEQYAGFPVATVPGMTVRGFRMGVPAPVLVRTLAGFRPDVVRVASPFGLGYQALLAARRDGVPSVALFQTDVAGFASRQGLGAAAPALWAWVRRIHARADVNLAPSSASIAELRGLGLANVHRWSRGVDAVTYHPRRRTGAGAAALRARLLDGAPRGAVVVGYVGRLAPEK